MTLAEAARTLQAVADAADPNVRVPRKMLDALIRTKKMTKRTKVLGEAHFVGARHVGHAGLELGESATIGAGGFRYTNGEFGGRGGRKAWLKCESDCKGSGYGGYGFCYTAGVGQPWGGCMPPGAQPTVETPPKMYTENRIDSVDNPRAHRFCNSGSEIWMRSGGTLVAGCTECESDDYFLVPNHHIESKMVGSCFAIDEYENWVNAVTASSDGATVPLACSVFTNGKGMKTNYFGGSDDDVWDSAPSASPYNPRAFVCSTASTVNDRAVDGEYDKGFREMRVFKTTVARFVMCHTSSHDGAWMGCVKKTRVGKCHVFKMRNAAFDDTAMYLKLNSNQSYITNSTTGEEILSPEESEKRTAEWDKKAEAHGMAQMAQDLNNIVTTGVVGLGVCEQQWTERLLAVHQ
jgi:hypothetical protein